MSLRPSSLFLFTFVPYAGVSKRIPDSWSTTPTEPSLLTLRMAWCFSTPADLTLMSDFLLLPIVYALRVNLDYLFSLSTHSVSPLVSPVFTMRCSLSLAIALRFDCSAVCD